MSFGHGSGTVVLVDGADLSGYFRSADYSASIPEADITTFGAAWRSYLAGIAESEFSLEGLYDPTLGDIKDLLPTTPGLVTVIPAGMGVGRFASVLSTSYVESAPVGDVVSFSWAMIASSAAGWGQVVQAPTTVTSDGNGSAVDGGAASSNGAIAQLHVMSVSAGDSIVVTIEDSSTGSSGWATIGTFASKTAPGAERITIAGTVKRYVRAAWNETNNGGPSYTLAVSLARE